MKGGTPYMGISHRRMRPCTHRPEREQERFNALHPAALHRTRSGRMSLKKCVFGCKGKITLFSFPKNPALRKQWIQFVFGAAMEILKCVCWRKFYKRGPVRRWICASLVTERWSGLSYKRSRSWFRTADGKLNGIKCLCFVGDRRSSARHSLAPPTARLQELGCFRRES